MMDKWCSVWIYMKSCIGVYVGLTEMYMGRGFMVGACIEVFRVKLSDSRQGVNAY